MLHALTALALVLVASATFPGPREMRNAIGGDAVNHLLENQKSAALRLRLTFNGAEAVVNLRDNPTSRELLSSLPMTLTLSDYGGTEKVAALPRRLSTENAPEGIEPSIGDFTYYAPWGNLAIFYKGFRYSKGLVALGRMESGMEHLAALEGDATVTIRKID
jgi:hypothetical protein